jgi:hypothetical protein
MKAERPGFKAVPQVVAHAGHGFGHERFGAELLEQLEQHSRHGFVRPQPPVQARFAASDAQRQTVSRTAERLEVVVGQARVQVRREAWQHAFAAVQPLAAKQHVGCTAECTDRRGAQLQGALLRARLALRLAHAAPPLSKWDSPSSRSKQRW